MNNDLISKSTLLKEIEDNYDCNYGKTLIDPRHFYDLVEEQTIIHSDWILCSDKLPEPKEWCWIWFDYGDGDGYCEKMFLSTKGNWMRNTMSMIKDEYVENIKAWQAYYEPKPLKKGN